MARKWDPYYTEEGGVRREYYGVSGAPSLKLEGDEGRFNDTQLLQEKLDETLQIPSYFLIESTHSLTASGLIDIDVTIIPYIGDYHRIHIVVLEKETTGNIGSNGETSFRNVMMKMMPDAEGTLLNFIPNESVNLNFSEDLSTTFIEEMDDLEVIVFIQEEGYSKTVMQSEISILETLNNEEFELNELNIYPNPSHGTIKLETSQPINITIYNVLGEEVLNKREVNSNMELNVSELSSGVYLVKLYKDNFVEIKRLIIE